MHQVSSLKVGELSMRSHATVNSTIAIDTVNKLLLINSPELPYEEKMQKTCYSATLAFTFILPYM